MRRLLTPAHLLPLVLLAAFLFGFALSPLAPQAGAQSGQKSTATAPAADGAGNIARPSYPATKKVEHVDKYHGVDVADPYRWLEDENSADTAAWVEAENRVTFSYLEKIPFRAQIAARLEKPVSYTHLTLS